MRRLGSQRGIRNDTSPKITLHLLIFVYMAILPYTAHAEFIVDNPTYCQQGSGTLPAAIFSASTLGGAQSYIESQALTGLIHYVIPSVQQFWRTSGYQVVLVGNPFFDPCETAYSHVGAFPDATRYNIYKYGCNARQPYALVVTRGVNIGQRYSGYEASSPFYCVIAEPKSSCPVDELNPNYPPAGDTCTVALETGKGNPVPRSACPAAPVMSDPLGEPCLARRLATIGVPYAGPTSTIRTAAYQAHLFDVWDRNVEHHASAIKNNPTLWAACAEKRAKVVAEMTHHSITDAPAANGSLHISGNAFDISRATVDSVPSIPHLLRFNQPGDPACNLRWGNTFNPPDKVHFYTP